MNLTEIFKKKREKLLEEAIALTDNGHTKKAIALYQKIIRRHPSWAIPCYNLGLIYKYQTEWRQSFEYNNRVIELDASNEAAWWNLGIAATALEDWKAARQAWNFFGFNLEINDDELNLNVGRTPIRLNPDGDGEVVWGRRIDPARTIIESIPFPKSNHRYNDLILNDGAPVGQRISNGVEYNVFNELQLIKRSNFSTYSVMAKVNQQEHIDKLEKLCDNSDIAFEDWSTVRYLCRKCSEGTPHEHHDQDIEPRDPIERKFGFAAIDKDSLDTVLADWRAITLCDHSELVLELA